MDDKSIVDALDAAAFDVRFFRRRANGAWEYFHQADGPPMNRWVLHPDLRSCLAALKTNNDTLAAKRAAAVAAKAAKDQAAKAAKVVQPAKPKPAAKPAAASPSPAIAAAPSK